MCVCVCVCVNEWVYKREREREREREICDVWNVGTCVLEMRQHIDTVTCIDHMFLVFLLFRYYQPNHVPILLRFLADFYCYFLLFSSSSSYSSSSSSSSSYSCSWIHLGFPTYVSGRVVCETHPVSWVSLAGIFSGHSPFRVSLVFSGVLTETLWRFFWGDLSKPILLRRPL